MNMKCPVCEFESESSLCEQCGSTISSKKYRFNPPLPLTSDVAMFQFAALKNPVRAGFVQISVPLRKAKLLDICGQLRTLEALIKSTVLSYSSFNGISQTLSGEYDFVYVGKYLTKIQQPKDFLKLLRGHLNHKGVVQFFIPAQPAKSDHFIFAMPAFYSMLLVCGYRMLERTMIETPDGIIVSAQ